MKCDTCGAESDFDAGFVKQRAAVGRPGKNICPACWVKQGHRRSAWFLPTMAMGAVFGYAADRISREGSPPGRFLMYICGAALFMVLTIIPHELGHAVVARAVGWRVYQIVIGVGKSVFKRRWFGTLFDLRTLPLAGATLTVPKDTRWFRLKGFLVIAAGPAVNAILAAGVVLLLRGSLRNFDLDDLPVWARLFLIANLFVLFINLWPHQPRSGFDIPTDGKQLLRLISFRKKAMDQVRAQLFALEAGIFREQSDFASARAWCDKGLASYPEDFQLLNMSGVVYLDEGKYEAAREAFLKLLRNDKQPPGVRFLFLNNLAYADALTEKPELLPEADTYSKEAYAGLPWMASVMGTRGTVLVAMGKYDEGIALLRKSMDDADTARSKAENACHLAEAMVKTGQKADARKYVELARQLDAGCPLLERAERLLVES